MVEPSPNPQIRRSRAVGMSLRCLPRALPSGAKKRTVQHHRGALVLIAHQLEPLHEGEAAGVGEQQHVGPGQRLAVRRQVAPGHHPQVGLDVGADVLRGPALLGLGDVVARDLLHAGLDGVDLGEVVEEVEGQQQLVQVPGDEGGGHLAAALGGAGEQVVVVRDHLLLLHHRRFLDHRGGRGAGLGPGAHGVLHSLMESAKVPACSRTGCICPEFSAYLKPMWGTSTASSRLSSMGRSRSAGSQKLGAAKMTPSAPLSRTESMMYLPFSARLGWYLAEVSMDRCRKALHRLWSGSPDGSTSPWIQRVTSMKSSSTT